MTAEECPCTAVEQDCMAQGNVITYKVAGVPEFADVYFKKHVILLTEDGELRFFPKGSKWRLPDALRIQIDH